MQNNIDKWIMNIDYGKNEALLKQMVIVKEWMRTHRAKNFSK